MLVLLLVAGVGIVVFNTAPLWLTRTPTAVDSTVLGEPELER